MSRYKLIGAVKEVAELLGYKFYTGQDAAMAAKIKSYPALWLSPPEIKKMSGRMNCRDVYKIEMMLMMSPNVSPRTEPEEVWRILEDDAVALRRNITSHKSIRSVSDFRITPNRKYVTKNGEITMSVECEVVLFYYYKKRG